MTKEKLAAFISELKKITPEMVIVRLLTAWAVMSVFQNLISQNIFTSDLFFSEFTLVKSAVSFVIIFAVLCIPVFENMIKPLLFSSFFLMFWMTLPEKREFGYCIGACILMTLICRYVFSGVKFDKDIPKMPAYIMTTVVAAGVGTFIAAVTIILYKAYWTPTYDFGIFSQMFYYMKETLQPLTTCERDELLSHFAVHFSPVYYLLLPVYFVFPSPITLLVMQSVIISSGVIPLYLLCRKYKFSNLTSFCASVVYFGIPGIVGGNFYYIHENVFLAPFLLWLFYFIEKNKAVPVVVWALLVMSVKEDAPVYIIFIGLYLLFSKRNIRLGAVLTGIALVYFVIVTGCIEKFGDGAMFNRFDNFSKDGKPTTMTGVILTVFRNPAYFISECFENGKIQFFIQFFLPVLFLPFFTKHYSRFILLCPVILVNLMSDYYYQHDMGYQYVFGPGAFVVYLTVLNLSDIENVKRSKLAITAAVCSALVFSSMFVSKADYLKTYALHMEEHNSIAQALELVPDDASVAASTFFVANLSQRNEIYELESTENEADYYIIDLRVAEGSELEKYKTSEYEEICINPYIAIYKRNQMS